MAARPGIGIRVDTRSAISALLALQGRVEPAVKDALDRGAAKVQEHARNNHPKISPQTLRSVRRLGRDRVSILRPKTGTDAGQFSGQFRFLTRTGILRNSIKMKRARKVRGGFNAEVFSTVKYADKIEFGTPKTPAYPFLRPALEANRGKIAKLIIDAVRGSLRRPLP